ncbi:MAG: efflux RND transporter periplasmic adaptor subunit [Curvibacter sp.]
MPNRFPFLILSAVLLTACSDAPSSGAQAPAPIVQDQRLRYAAGHPQLRLLPTTSAQPARAMQIDLPARVVWNEERTQRVYPSFAGRVTAIRADVGQRVSAGSPLAVLASPDFGQAQSETARAEADERLASRNLQRQRELFESGIVPRKELEQAEAEFERARAEANRARARTSLYGSNAGVNQELLLRATLAGNVVERNLNPGQELRPDQAGAGVPPLFVISDPSTLWVQIDVRDHEIALVRPGQKFSLRVPVLAGQVFEGVVVASADFIYAQTRTIKVRARVANPKGLLKAEMLGTAAFERRFAEGVVIPANASLLQGAQHWVFVQTRPGEFERRRVEISYEGTRDVVISAGLAAGEQVVSENALLLARQFRLARAEALPASAAPAAGYSPP